MKKFITRNAMLVKKGNGYSIYKIYVDGYESYIYFLSKHFSKYQNIILKEDGTVMIEYMYLFGGSNRPYKVKKILCKPIIDRQHLNFVVYKGAPNIVFGLDDGIYKSSYLLCQTKYIYFLSIKDFGIFKDAKKLGL